MAKRMRFWVQILVGLAVAVGGWALFNLVRALLQTVLADVGLVSEIQQSLAIFVLVLVILLALGLGFKDSLKKLAK